MSKNNKHARVKSNALKLGHITQVKKILQGFEETGYIVSFGRYKEEDKNLLEYRVYFNKDNFFNLKICFAKIFHPQNGAEIHREGWQLTILIDRNCTAEIAKLLPKTTKSLIREYIESRKKGIATEIAFEKAMRKLITEDVEVSRIISDVRKAEDDFEDILQKTDFFLPLVEFPEIEFPLQIKSSFAGIKKEKKNGSNIPKLYFHANLLENHKLKNIILNMVKQYLQDIAINK